jgi:hypothetical protein
MIPPALLKKPKKKKKMLKTVIAAPGDIRVKTLIRPCFFWREYG